MLLDLNKKKKKKRAWFEMTEELRKKNERKRITLKMDLWSLIRENWSVSKQRISEIQLNSENVVARVKMDDFPLLRRLSMEIWNG